MTQLHQRNLARHMLLARQGGNGNGNGNGNNGNGNGFGGGTGGGTPILPLFPSPASSTTPDTPNTPTSPTPTATPPAPSPSSIPPLSIPSSKDSTPSTSSDPVILPTSSSPPLVVKSTTSASTTSDVAPTSTSNASTTTSSSKPSSSSTALSTSSVLPVTVANPIVNANPLTILSDTASLTDLLPTGAATTVSATPTGASSSSGLSAGPIIGAVAGTIAGLAALGFLIAFILRRYRQKRRRALHDSDFGTTFRRSAFVTPRAATPDMVETTDHNVGPSLNEPYIAYPAATAQPPSQALATATTAAVARTAVINSGGLQERPKYVYGQEPKQPDDVASDIAQGGAYSSQPQPQGTYNAEAYGSYAKYEDLGNGVVGSVPGGGAAMYQDAQRAYQGQQGYDQGQYASYDQSHYAGYGQQQQQFAAYDYSQQHQAYATGSNRAEPSAHAVAYGGI